MTLLKCLQLGLQKAGLSQSASTFQDTARDYFNIGIKEVASMHDWRWLYKEGSISASSSTNDYDLANGVLKPLSFRTTTNDYSLKIVDNFSIDFNDPDESETGNSDFVAAARWNATNGVWEVRFYPAPSANDTIKYRYMSYLTDFTSSNDSTETDVLGVPDWIATAMLHYVASKLQGVYGDFQGSQDDDRIFREMVGKYIRLDTDIDGIDGHKTGLTRRDRFGSDFKFNVQLGTLS